MDSIAFRDYILYCIYVILLLEFVDPVKTIVDLIEFCRVKVYRFEQTANLMTYILQVDIAAVYTLDKFAHLWINTLDIT